MSLVSEIPEVTQGCRGFPTKNFSPGNVIVGFCAGVQTYLAWQACPLREKMSSYSHPGPFVLLNIYRPLSQPPSPTKHQFIKNALVNRNLHVTQVLQWAVPCTHSDTVSISCEQGTFRVPPLLFNLCLEKNKNYLLGMVLCLFRALLGIAWLRHPRDMVLAAKECWGWQCLLLALGSTGDL